MLVVWRLRAHDEASKELKKRTDARERLRHVCLGSVED